MSLDRSLLTALALALCWSPPSVQASNTAPTRSFTTDWLCDNGRLLRFNSHPRRAETDAQLTYIGSRVEVFGTPAASGVRYENKDGKVVWHSKGDEGQLTFDPLLSEPITCRLKPARADSKSQPNR